MPHAVPIFVLCNTKICAATSPTLCGLKRRVSNASCWSMSVPVTPPVPPHCRGHKYRPQNKYMGEATCQHIGCALSVRSMAGQAGILRAVNRCISLKGWKYTGTCSNPMCISLYSDMPLPYAAYWLLHTHAMPLQYIHAHHNKQMPVLTRYPQLTMTVSNVSKLLPSKSSSSPSPSFGPLFTPAFFPSFSFLPFLAFLLSITPNSWSKERLSVRAESSSRPHSACKQFTERQATYGA